MTDLRDSNLVNLADFRRTKGKDADTQQQEVEDPKPTFWQRNAIRIIVAAIVIFWVANLTTCALAVI